MRESDHDCVQPRDDFLYAYSEIQTTPTEAPASDKTKTVERAGKSKGNGLDSLGGGKLV